MREKMTVDEAIIAIRECAYHSGLGAESVALTEDAARAEKRIREAFAVRDRARDDLARMLKVQRENAGLRFAKVEKRIATLKRILGED